PNTVVARQLYWGWSTFAPRPGARARQLYWGWSTFAPRPDGGVLALSFVTALIARPWKVGVRVRITCGNVPGAPPYSWQKLAECELDCSGTIDARFCAWRTPGGVKSVHLCELSVPGTEARCRPSHYRLSDDPQLRTGARKNCIIDDAALPWACPPPAPAPNCFAGGVKSVNLCELSVPGTEARCHRDEG